MVGFKRCGWCPNTNKNSNVTILKLTRDMAIKIGLSPDVSQYLCLEHFEQPEEAVKTGQRKRWRSGVNIPVVVDDLTAKSDNVNEVEEDEDDEEEEYMGATDLSQESRYDHFPEAG